ncbi:hypothetical protein B0H14DRAFT_2637194 [Mycena olivaceomarginata]|nr:hypothetical protein B0H14DRAFT_2637194 [Mycena olivaceomarginata]
MAKWMCLMRDIYLVQLLRRDGCADASSSECPRCGGDSLRFRCQECAGGLLLCKACCLDKHADDPLHAIFEWNGIFFEKTTLRTLGQHIQLGHPPRESSCANGWFPVSDGRPQTAATFLVLDQFHLHTLQAKTTAYDFYAVLEHLTDNAGVKPPDRYQIFLRMARQYRHLLMLKRAGRGHDSSGVWGTGAGELAIECPVCPDPKVNLPEGWENALPEDQFLYVLFIALDACFRLKRRMISSEFKDPGLGTGWAYVTENAPYCHFLLTVTDQKEMSTCSGLAALDYANTKFSRGYSTTGVGMGVCARHEFVQPNGVGDLQRGERFANMDYIFGSILCHKDPRLRKLISYDIVCQWWKYLLERLRNLPVLVRITIILKMFRFVIPKMHIHAHTLACQVKFSLNLVPGSGQTNGEGIEHPWSNIGVIATSTHVSGPGARHDMLDDHWNFWNWLKTIGLPKQLLAAILRRRLDNARKEQVKQREGFELFTLQQAEQVPAWKEMVEEFEADETKKNPYEVKITGLTEAEVRLKFAQEEEEEAKNGVPVLHEVTPSSFIAAGLELEEQQRQVRIQAELKKAGTTAMVINMKTLRNKLNRGIIRFRKLQATYSPAAIQVLTKWVAHAEELAEDTPLMLPSALAPEECENGGCLKGVLKIEDDMRAAQCRTALPRLRNQLHIKSRLLLYKKHNSRHQGMNTRSRMIVARNESKIRLHSEKFQMAWQAWLRIARGEKSKVGWPQLKKEDIRCMQDAEMLSRNAEKRRKANERRVRKESEMREDGLLPQVEEDEDDEMVAHGGENMREVSWIWTVAGTHCVLSGRNRGRGVGGGLRRSVSSKKSGGASPSPTRTGNACGYSAPSQFLSGKAQLFRDLAGRAETTRTEAKLPKGKKRKTYAPTWDPIISVNNDESVRPDNELDDNDDEAEDDDERGDIESDEELLMGGEVDED